MLGLSLPDIARRPRGGSAPPPPPPWTPAALGASLLGWWDPNDDATITLSGATVSQVADKSGRARHLVQSVAAVQAGRSANASFNNRKVLDFTADRLQAQSAWWDTTTYAAFVMVATASNQDIVGSGAISAAGNVLLVRYLNKLRAHHWTAPGAIDGVTTLDSNPHLVAQLRNATTLTSFLDGSQEATSAGATGSSTSQTFIVGGRDTSSTASFTLGEVILTRGDIATLDRQRIEGFMLWNAGRQSQLPSAHPFRNAPP
jgi:hypothetical protein